MRIFQTEQARAREVDVIRFNLRRHVLQRQRTVRGGVDGLRLNAAEHRRAASFIEIIMRALTDDILFAAFTMAKQRDQIGTVPVGKSAASLPERSAA